MNSIFVWLLSLTIFAVLAWSISTGFTPQNTRQTRLTQAETLQQNTIALYNVDEEGEAIAYCAGVWVDKTHILTAAHCIEIDIPEQFVSLDGSKLDINPVGVVVKYAVFDDFKTRKDVPANSFKPKTAIVQSVEKQHDLALLEVVGYPPEHPVALLSRQAIRTGDPVSTVGHTVAYTWSYTPGTIGMIRMGTGPEKMLVEEQEMIQIAMPMWFGNSGGGVFNNNGELIGIASWIVQRGPGIGFAIHRDIIFNFLSKNRLTNL